MTKRAVTEILVRMLIGFANNPLTPQEVKIARFALTRYEADMDSLLVSGDEEVVERFWSTLSPEKLAELSPCQSTNHAHDICQYPFWVCEKCGKTMCCEEGYDSSTHRQYNDWCDSCWGKAKGYHDGERM